MSMTWNNANDTAKLASTSTLRTEVPLALDPISGDLHYTGAGARRLRYTRTRTAELVRQQRAGPLGAWGTGDDVVVGVPDDALPVALRIAMTIGALLRSSIAETQIILVWEHPAWPLVRPGGIVPEQPVVYDIGYSLGGDADDADAEEVPHG